MYRNIYKGSLYRAEKYVISIAEYTLNNVYILQPSWIDVFRKQAHLSSST